MRDLVLARELLHLQPMMTRLAVLAAVMLTGCLKDDTTAQGWESDASCITTDALGTRCEQYALYEPAQQDTLAGICSGPGSQFDGTRDCPADPTLGSCELDQPPLVRTYVYAGYQQPLAQIIAACEADGGTWNPSEPPPTGGEPIRTTSASATRR